MDGRILDIKARLSIAFQTDALEAYQKKMVRRMMNWISIEEKLPDVQWSGPDEEGKRYFGPQ